MPRTVQEKIALRQATLEDEAFIVSLAARFAEARSPWRSEAEVTGGTARVLSSVVRNARDTETLIVAERDGVRLGFVYVYEESDFFTNEPHAHVSEVAVTGDGTGAGRALMDAAEAWSRGRGHRYVSLHVNPANPRAERLYSQLGFELEYKRMCKLLER